MGPPCMCILCITVFVAVTMQRSIADLKQMEDDEKATEIGKRRQDMGNWASISSTARFFSIRLDWIMRHSEVQSY